MASSVTHPVSGSMRDQYQLFWGDVHNHNAVGYAKGSLERSIDIAREHLDFFAFTGHASWHDMPLMPGDRHMKWVNGFDVHTKHWPKTRQLIKEATSDSFVAFLGYEWHSSAFGDYHLIFPEDQPDLYLPDHVEQLLDFAKQKGALAIPHHVGYKLPWRGANWAYFRPDVTPVVEIFSEHGNCVSDRSPMPMLRHSNGGRQTSNTIHYQLAQGLRFGFVASTDDHLGYPGAYGEGIVGVWAEQLTPASLFDAIWNRRTYASTGERTAVDFTLNGHPMGSELPATAVRNIDVWVSGQDSIEMIELLRNGRTIKRHFPDDDISGPLTFPSRAKCRIQYGWGPWAALALGRICQWDMRVTIDGGRFMGATCCFQSGPFHEDLRDTLRLVSEHEIQLQSFTSRDGCFAEDPTKSIICDIEANPGATLNITLTQPTHRELHIPVQDLITDNVIDFTDVFTSESLMVHRLVAPGEYAAAMQWEDQPSQPRQADWYYVRVRHHNGHMAWSSPIWVG
ncbi:DUF3604 domain-containing protein [candidate division KSB3 bacterium]|uniref:DUF3604 domain-containing protein n=1 Tax=candidate division KSB3 bacterium TaxID=2044937 RepID=A0A9D5JYV8_9BACT|nr:DUF3604 domain-containing protein [candidate division KSB3 bacterium]MBD3326658.1 DUF3604 domain-containing protein [candidate division KSB3 bacterium]